MCNDCYLCISHPKYNACLKVRKVIRLAEWLRGKNGRWVKK